MIVWTEEMLSLLGKDTDHALAERFGISNMTVARKRNELQIPIYEWRASGVRYQSLFKWTPESIARLGKEPDLLIAQSLGISRQAVYIKRKSLKIKAPRQRAPRVNRLPVDAIPLLGTCSDSALAARFGIPADVVFQARRSRKIPAAHFEDPIPHGLLDALGTASDRVLALRFGWHYSKIRLLRLQHSVPAYTGPRQKAGA